jgi:hypothetical protein
MTPTWIDRRHVDFGQVILPQQRQQPILPNVVGDHEQRLPDDPRAGEPLRRALFHSCLSAWRYQ